MCHSVRYLKWTKNSGCVVHWSHRRVSFKRKLSQAALVGPMIVFAMLGDTPVLSKSVLKDDKRASLLKTTLAVLKPAKGLYVALNFWATTDFLLRTNSKSHVVNERMFLMLAILISCASDNVWTRWCCRWYFLLRASLLRMLSLVIFGNRGNFVTSSSMF